MLNNTRARRDVEFLFECSGEPDISRVSVIFSLVVIQFFSVVEIPVKQSSLHNKQPSVVFTSLTIAQNSLATPQLRRVTSAEMNEQLITKLFTFEEQRISL